MHCYLRVCSYYDIVMGASLVKLQIHSHMMELHAVNLIGAPEIRTVVLAGPKTCLMYTRSSFS